MSPHYSRICGDIYQNSDTGKQVNGNLGVLLPEIERLRAEIVTKDADFVEAKEVIKMAYRGIKWWIDIHPLEAEECDFDAVKEIEDFLAAHPEVDPEEDDPRTGYEVPGCL